MNKKQPLSVTIITYNEEQHIRAARKASPGRTKLSEIDSQSTDCTVEICRAYTEHVYQIPWHGYVEQKNIATDKASHLWILNIDADERGFS